MAKKMMSKEDLIAWTLKRRAERERRSERRRMRRKMAKEAERTKLSESTEASPDNLSVPIILRESPEMSIIELQPSTYTAMITETEAEQGYKEIKMAKMMSKEDLLARTRKKMAERERSRMRYKEINHDAEE